MTITPKAAFWTASYIVAIVAVNWLFAPQQLVEGLTVWKTAWGDVFLANLVVGAVFVLRDYAQREIGHRVLVATAAAAALTYAVVRLTADPQVAQTIAIASLVAFMISETADWAIYSFWRRSLQSRILVSSMIAVPLDTFVFQHLAGYYSHAAFFMEVLSKVIGVFVVWQLLKLREPNTPFAVR
jgi:queuosine precursor transporter